MVSIKLKSLKRGDLFVLKDIMYPNHEQVWIKDEYDHSTKKFLVVNYADLSHSKQLTGDKLVYTDFIF